MKKTCQKAATADCFMQESSDQHVMSTQTVNESQQASQEGSIDQGAGKSNTLEICKSETRKSNDHFPSSSNGADQNNSALSKETSKFVQEIFVQVQEELEDAKPGKQNADGNHDFMDLNELERQVLREDDDDSDDDLDLFDDDFDDDDPEPSEPADLSYPYGVIDLTAECEICLSQDDKVRLRLCCQIPVCDSCMQRYFVAQIESGHKRMHCIASKCSEFVHVQEITCRLPPDLKEKFCRYLIDANNDPYVKTCPKCSFIQKVKKEDVELFKHTKRNKYGYLIVCEDCKLLWCFLCHAPWHSNVTCKDYRKGDKLVKSWAKEQHYGKKNAERCPKCKVFIERNGGCDQMTCGNCNTSFCYRCGQRFFHLKFIGDHYGRLSPFGCKYNFLPDRPVARRVARGSVLGAKLFGGILLGSLVIGIGAVLVAASPILLPAYFGNRLRIRRAKMRRMKRRNINMGIHIEQMIENEILEALRKSMAETGREDEDIDLSEILNALESGVASQTTQTNESDDSVSSLEAEITSKENVEVQVHPQGDPSTDLSNSSVTAVEVKNDDEVHIKENQDTDQTTTIELAKKTDMHVVLHVKTSAKVREDKTDRDMTEKKLRDCEVQSPNTDKEEINGKGCFGKILKKLPSVSEKDIGKIETYDNCHESNSSKGILIFDENEDADLMKKRLLISEGNECLNLKHKELQEFCYEMIATTDEITHL